MPAARCQDADEPGEFRAPLTPSDFDGPGRWRWLCLEHVREHNAKYNFFEGMSRDEIEAAQSPIAGWERATRAFAHVGADAGPAWRDFADPLDAIAARFRPEARRACARSLHRQRAPRAGRDRAWMTTPTCTSSAGAIRSWSAATIPTATAATAAMRSKLGQVIEA